MVLVLLACWCVAGLLLALVLGGAVRVAESRRAWETPAEDVEDAETAGTDLAATA